MSTFDSAASLLADDRLSDEEIVTRVCAGEPALFELLVRRHNQRIYRAARAILRVDDEVQDVMQQAYLNAYQHLHQFAGGAKFSTWLTRIAVNEALGRKRKGQREVGEGDESAMISLVESNTPDPEQQANTAELRTILEREVSALPTSFRVVIVMRDVEGLNTTETAEILGISEDLVKQRLHRGRAMLRDELIRRTGVTLESAFTFGNARCDRVVANVMAQLSTIVVT